MPPPQDTQLPRADYTDNWAPGAPRKNSGLAAACVILVVVILVVLFIVFGCWNKATSETQVSEDEAAAATPIRVVHL